MLDRILDELLQLTLDTLEPSDIFPGDIWNLDCGFTQGAWITFAESPLDKIKQTNVNTMQRLKAK